MSTHAEWAGVTDCPINLVPIKFNVDEWGEVECSTCENTGLITYEDGTQESCGEYHEEGDPERTTEGPSIILGDDTLFVITAERPEQLVEFARTLLRMAEDFEKGCSIDRS